MRSLDIAATGMQAMQLNVDVVSQNLANMTTVGYKRQHAEFQDLIYQQLRRVGANSSDSGTIVPTGIQLGTGVKTAAVYRNMSQGNVQSTEGKLDVAIQGDGYLQVQMPNGDTAYTRAGALQLNASGQVVTADGYLLQPNITIPSDAVSVSIGNTGVVEVTINGQTTPQNVGQIELATFLNQPGLEAMGNNLYKETNASGSPVTGNPGTDNFGTLLQGYLENSNVNPVSEITNLIVAQRAYDMNSKVVTASDQMLQALNQAA